MAHGLIYTLVYVYMFEAYLGTWLMDVMATVFGTWLMDVMGPIFGTWLVNVMEHV